MMEIFARSGISGMETESVEKEGKAPLQKFDERPGGVKSVQDERCIFAPPGYSQVAQSESCQAGGGQIWTSGQLPKANTPSYLMRWGQQVQTRLWRAFYRVCFEVPFWAQGTWLGPIS